VLGKQKRFQRFLAMLLCLINVATTINNDRFSEPIKKSTRIQATKNDTFNLMNRRCQGDHTHCPLEGSMPAPSPDPIQKVDLPVSDPKSRSSASKI
jgi:hypothetical protein